MTRYDYLTQELNDKLGQEFDIKYFDNESVTWKDILIDNAIHGVVTVNGGSTSNTGRVMVEVQTYTMTCMLPMEISKHTEALGKIEKVFGLIVNYIFEWGTEFAKFEYNNRSDLSKYTVDGIDYAAISFSFNVTYYTNAVLGNEAKVEIKLNNEWLELNGVTNITYKSTHQSDGVVLGNQSAVQGNYLASIQKALTIDLILCRNDELHIDLMENDGTNKKYEVKYYNGFIERNMTMSVLDLTEFVPKGNTSKGQLVLGVKKV